MTAVDLVVIILWIEGTALAGVMAFILGYAIWSRRAAQERERRLSAARGIVAIHLEDGVIPADQMASLRELSMSEQVRLFYDVGSNVGDVERRWLRQLADDLGLIDKTVARTRSPLWWKRLSGSRTLTVLGAEPGVMHGLLADREPMVRVQAAAYIAQHPTPAGIDALIAMLADDLASCRFAAKDALMRLGARAAPLIIARLDDHAEPRVVPLLEVACATASHGYMQSAVGRLSDPRPEVRLLVARLLRGIGGPAAADYLVELAIDESERVRETAIEALGFLNHWPASAAIGRMLDDPVSRVRLSAAVALDRLGPTGELLLRRARAKGSEVASAAARRILDDPSRAARAPLPGAAR